MKGVIISTIALCVTAPLALRVWPAPADKTKAASQADRVVRGKAVFDYNCAPCHGPGIGNPGLERKPGTDALFVKYKGERPALLAERKDLTPEVVAYFVRNGVSSMPQYRKTEINDDDVADLGAYLSRNNPDLKKSR